MAAALGPGRRVSYGYVWATIAVAQGVLAVLAIALYALERSRRAAAGGALGVEGAATALLAEGRLAELLALLHTLPAGAAIRALTAAIARCDDERTRSELVRRSRDDVGAQRVLAGAGSPLWWKRLASARLLALIGDGRERATLRALLLDEHPAVQSAATAALRRYADEELVGLVIDGLSARSSAVRAYQVGVLAARADLAVPLLLERLRPDAPAHKLYAYVYAAEAVDTAECRARVAEISTHPHPEVRVAVARALKRPRDERTRVKLLAMLRDNDWRVRAQAARALGGEEPPNDHTVQELVRALRDPTWWVRFRAALALAGMGTPGRTALAEARTHPDRYARDMATLVSDLPAASVAELAAG